jgi:hypothetical protein
MGPKSLQHYKKEYDDTLATGFFYEYFPQLTGDWDSDKHEFVKAQKEMKSKVQEKIRNKKCKK